MRENAAVQALSTAKARGMILLPHVIRLVDDDGDERVDSDGKPMTVEGLVAETRQSDDYGFAFDGDGAPGSNSGSTSSNTKASEINPWSKKYFNATEQAKILRANPSLAKRLEQQAAAEGQAT